MRKVDRDTSGYDVRICGIPAIVEVISYSKGWGGSWYEPPEPEEVEYVVRDRKGYRADWLEAKMSSSDRSDLEDFLIEMINDYDPY